MREQLREKERKRMKCNECEREVEVADGIALCHYHYNNENLCGDCLIPISQCAHKLYLLNELERDANRLIQLTKEREAMR